MSKKSKPSKSGSKKAIKPKEPTIDEVEESLNEKVNDYNGFDENNPMKGVKWNASRNTYFIKISNKINTCSKNLDIACKKVMDVINNEIRCEETENDANDDEDDEQDDSDIDTFKKESDFIRFKFNYEKIYFITFRFEKELYFDIRHIIALLDVNDDNVVKKYNKYKDQIVYRYWFANEFNGYLLRELIDSDCMFEILLNSNSTFGKQFKTHVAKILSDLLKMDMLKSDENGLELRKTEMEKKKKEIELAITHEKYVYDNPIHFDHIFNLVLKGNKINLSPYLKKHVIYAFLILLNNTSMTEMIIKFGYTHDIVSRIGSLSNEYDKSRFILLGIRFVESEEDEKKFHAFLGKIYSDLRFEMEIKGKKKVEVYYYNPSLMNEFDSFLPEINPGTTITTMTDEAKKVMEMLSIELDKFFDSATSFLKNEPEYVKTILKLRHEMSLEHERRLTEESKQKTLTMEKEVGLINKKNYELALKVEKERNKNVVQKKTNRS